MNKYFVGIDLGTSSLKAVLTNEIGTILSSSSESYSHYISLNFSEQDPNEWVSALQRSIASLGERNDLGFVEGISFSGQMHGLVCLGKENTPIRSAILWDDERSKKESAEINMVFGEKEIMKLTGNISYPGFWGSKILWLKRNEKSQFNATKHFLFPKDYLVYAITNRIVTDVSDASGSLLLNPKSKKWSKKMLSYLGVKEEQMPQVLESQEVVGFVTKEFARISGLPTTAKVIVGGGDQAVGTFASRISEKESMMISLGTSGVVCLCQTAFPKPTNGSTHIFCSCDGRYIKMGVTLSAGASLSWLTKNVLETEDLVEELNNLGDFSVSDPLFLPYLVGERSPIKDPNAKACFFGLRKETDRKSLIRSVMEGVGFSLYDCCLALKAHGIKKAFVTGGGSNSPFWCQFLATLFNMTIIRPFENRDPSYGAAMLAAVGTGNDLNSSEIKGTEYYPVKKDRPTILKRFRNYKSLYLCLKALETPLETH